MSPCLGLVQPKATLDLCTLASKGKIVIFGVIHHHFGNMSVLLYCVARTSSPVAHDYSFVAATLAREVGVTWVQQRKEKSKLYVQLS